MDKIIGEFEKALAEYKAKVGKTDTLVGCGEIIVTDLRKQREAVVVLGNCLAEGFRREAALRHTGGVQFIPWPTPAGTTGGAH